MTTGVGAVLFTAQVEAGANVVVFGLGGIGLNVIQGAKMVGADKIIGVDLNPEREAMAQDMHEAMQAEHIQLERFVEAWFSPDAQGALQALAARLGKN